MNATRPAPRTTPAKAPLARVVAPPPARPAAAVRARAAAPAPAAPRRAGQGMIAFLGGLGGAGVLALVAAAFPALPVAGPAVLALGALGLAAFGALKMVEAGDDAYADRRPGASEAERGQNRRFNAGMITVAAGGAAAATAVLSLLLGGVLPWAVGAALFNGGLVAIAAGILRGTFLNGAR